ncbi:MAG: PAS domain-containing sensor histidine kinase [Clostridia bacterium]
MGCKYIKCNRAFEESIGIKESDLKEKNAYDIFAAELAKAYNEMERELLDSEGVQVCESVMSFADGCLRNIILNEALFKDTSGNPIGIVGVITDITDKKESEMLKQSLVEKKLFIDKIVEYDKMKTEFFANISHELRTPLNVILGSVQLIEMYSKSNTYIECQTKVIRNIAIMRQNCYRLLRLVNNLIDVTKIDACSFEIHLKNCNIVSIVEEITLSVSEYVENKGINLVFDTDIEEKIIACDAEKIERIMLNLLSNAVKFTPKGGNIYVSVYDKCDSLCIQVSDSGIGIPQDKQKEIFRRFCQISNILSRPHEGSGIGLNLVKSLVEMHGGTICVESEFEKDTVFTINLPVKTVSEEEYLCTPLEKHDHVERIQIEFSDVYSVC